MGSVLPFVTPGNDHATNSTNHITINIECVEDRQLVIVDDMEPAFYLIECMAQGRRYPAILFQ